MGQIKTYGVSWGQKVLYNIVTVATTPSYLQFVHMQLHTWQLPEDDLLRVQSKLV